MSKKSDGTIMGNTFCCALSIALSLTLFSLNFLGDGLRDALDPRVSKA